ncbi:fasciclin domain-containing protein [Flavobacterium sp. CS20]|uniref:fasciclin domain-containing protein n=1 Tax=Flavobacterium sp. CS20 TaxID=2775246 RepID=UPI001B39E7C2|nr:fasciclin domain-containing protein [Flavobacterium sp. CS20]QTY26960.1 fasciclin domain-containing protein [Flavobacterium sp. CS20]
MKCKIKTLIAIFIVISAMTSCSDDEAGQIIDNTPSIFEIIAESPNHNTLEQLLIDTQLDQTIDSGVFTIFAPTDQAFQALDIANLSNEEISQILLNHVLSGKAESTDLETGYEFTNATESITGDSDFLNIYVNVDAGISLNGSSNVTEPDINASNGVVHVVDQVIPRPSIVTFLNADNNFSTLVSALTQENQPDFISTLSDSDNPAPFTLFAPNNQAFEDLFVELELESLMDMDANTLTSTLNTHIVASNVIRAEDFSANTTVETLGSSFNIDASTDTITDQSGRNINIFITNIQATNGVMHVVDKVILP